VWTELTHKHFIIAEMDGPGDALLLDDKAFYACEGSIRLSTHMQTNISGIIAGMGQGNGLMQPKLEGSGVFVVESPVRSTRSRRWSWTAATSWSVDGDLMLMYSAGPAGAAAPARLGPAQRHALGRGHGVRAARARHGVAAAHLPRHALIGRPGSSRRSAVAALGQNVKLPAFRPPLGAVETI
jgi:hypothetical protein